MIPMVQCVAKRLLSRVRPNHPTLESERVEFLWHSMAECMMAGLTSRDVAVKGSIIGVIIAVPTVVVFMVLWGLTGDLLMPAVAGAAVHFVALVFAFRLAKKFLVRRDPER